VGLKFIISIQLNLPAILKYQTVHDVFKQDAEEHDKTLGTQPLRQPLSNVQVPYGSHYPRDILAYKFERF